MTTKASEEPRTESIREIRDRLFMTFVSLELDIIPLHEVHHDMRVALGQLSKEESRRMRRRFRRLWRKYAKRENERFKTRALGVGMQPSRAQKQARKMLVYNALCRDFIKPMIKRFEEKTSKGQV